MFMRIVTLVFVAAMALGGCGPQISGTGLVIVDAEAAFYQRTILNNDTGTQEIAIEAVRRGLHAWDKAGAHLRLSDEAGNEIAPHFSIHWSSVEIQPAGVCWPGLGYADIYMDNIDGTQNLTSTVAHELGHAMGLSHITDDGIMNPADNEQRISDADDHEFKRVWD